MHKMAVADVTDFPNWYCNQWLHIYWSQKWDRFGFSAVCLHFTAVWIKFAEKVSVIKSKSFHSTTVNLLFVNCPKKSNVKNFQLFYCLANVAIDLPSKPISSQITWYSVTSQFTFFGTRNFPWIWNPWIQNSRFSSQFTVV